MKIKGDPAATKAYRAKKARVLAKTAPERKAKDKAKARANAAEAK